MANSTSPEEINEMFAFISERLKEHEDVSRDLLIDVLALKAVLTEEQAGAFKREREKALRESGYATHPNLHRYDEILAKYRGGQ